MLRRKKRTINQIGYLLIVIAILLTAAIVSYTQTPPPGNPEMADSANHNCGTVEDPVFFAEPNYWIVSMPPKLKGKVESSLVRLELTIDEKGKVIKAKAKTGHPLLLETAETEVLKLRFETAKACGKPVQHTFKFPYLFSASIDENDTTNPSERTFPGCSSGYSIDGDLGSWSVTSLVPESEGVSGKVEIRVTVDENGKYTDIKQVSGNPRLFERTKKFVPKFRSSPLILCGKAITDSAIYTFEFKVEEEVLSKGDLLFRQGSRLLDQKTNESKQEAIKKFKEGIINYRKEKKGSKLLFVAQMLTTENELVFLVEDAFIQAIEIFREEGKKNMEAQAQFQLGALLTGKSDSKGFEHLRQAFEIYRSLNDKEFAGYVLIKTGQAYFYLGENEKAINEFNKSIQILQSVEKLTHTSGKSYKAQALSDIARVYLRSGKNDKAITYFEKALPIFKRYGGGEPRKSPYGHTLIKIRVSVEMDDEGNWVSLIRDGEFRTLSDIGKAYFNLGQYQKALDYYKQALSIDKTYYEETASAEIYSEIMNVWAAADNRNVAIFYGKQAVNLLQKERANYKENGEIQKALVKTFEKTYRRLADLLIADGRFAQAEQVLQMLKEEEHFEFVRRDSGEIKNLSQRVSLNAKEKKVIKKYTEFADRILEIEKEYKEILEKKRSLFEGPKLSAEDQKRFDELSSQLATANAAFKLFIDKQLVEELGKAKTKEIEYDRDLQSKLKKWGDGTVALYTVLGEDRYRVIMTTPTVQIDGKTEIKASELNKKVFAFRDALQNPKVDPRPLGKELYDILIKPIEKELEAAGAKTLVWSLDGTLRYIPLAALSPDGKSYLVEKYQNAIITPKTRDDISVSDSNWQALGLGVSEAQTVINPEDEKTEIPFSELPGTKRELEAIVRDERARGETGVLIGTRFLDKDFTAGNFTDALLRETPEGKKKYTVVHIASHFRLGSNWSNSFLLLGNGQVLTLEEISNSPNISFGDVDLITLSACNTAFADESNGKEVDSLAEAIQTKSGKAVLATLWAVADDSTALLMSEFYRLKKENPQMTKAEAIQKAQMAMIAGKLRSSETSDKRDAGVVEIGKNIGLPKYVVDKNAPFAHPFYWSPFVLIGNWR